MKHGKLILALAIAAVIFMSGCTIPGEFIMDEVQEPDFEPATEENVENAVTDDALEKLNDLKEENPEIYDDVVKEIVDEYNETRAKVTEEKTDEIVEAVQEGKEPLQEPEDIEKPPEEFGGVFGLAGCYTAQSCMSTAAGGEWQCIDSRHISNGVRTIECLGGCEIRADEKHVCWEPDIPPAPPGTTYSCIGEHTMRITRGSAHEDYHCKDGCEVLADGSVICWIDADEDGGIPLAEEPTTTGQTNGEETTTGTTT